MATEVKLPDLGEGIEDATISRWLVAEGAEVNEGDIILEVATDKVDTEVPAPASGTILKLSAGEGELVELDAVLAVIGTPGEDVTTVGGDSSEVDAPTEVIAQPESPQTDETPASVTENGQGAKASPVAQRVAAERGVPLDSIPGTGPGGRITKEDVLASASSSESTATDALPDDLANVASPSVLRLAALYNIDLAEIGADRPLSTLTRYDVLNAIATRDAGEAVTVEPQFLPSAASDEEKAPATKATTTTTSPAAKPAPASSPTSQEIGEREELVKHSRMRQAIARNTASSLFSAPHVTTMWDVEMSAVLDHRKAHKAEFAAAGVNLTITAYFFEAIVAGLKAVPAANASWTDEGVVIKRTYNIGMAVALPQDKYGMGGLIVPVIKNVGELNLLGIARAVNDFAEKARNNQLRPEDLQDGTFTLSNYGTSGSRFQTPVIVQPQVGILGVGAIEKRPVVVSQGHPLEANRGDYLAYLPITTLGFSYDHRVLDGATADAFCAAVKNALENYE